jgi:hypothetical protein
MGILFYQVRGEHYDEATARALARIFCALAGHKPDRRNEKRWMITGPNPRGGHLCIRCDHPIIEWHADAKTNRFAAPPEGGKE